MSIKNMIRIIALSMGLLSAVTVTGFAQAPASSAPVRLDARWTPYLGCWRLFRENVRESDVPVSDVMIVCVAPSGSDPGVTMTTLVAGRVILEQKIIADGVGHPVTEPDCQGTQTSGWSRDGARVFTTATVQCSGRPMRVVSGVTLMARGPSWVDIQATEVDGESQVRIRRYQRTDTQPAGVAQLPAELTARAMAEAQAASAATMSLDDVIEASRKVSAAAVEAALDETGARFALNSRTLKQLADAGVSPDVIDLMVAQSFPQHFRVERAPSPAPPAPASASVGGTTVIYSGLPASMPYPYYDPYYSYYSYYSPFAYPYWGNGYYFNNYYYNTYYRGRAPGTTVIIQNGDSSSNSGGAVFQGQPPPGHVVNGRGYTRVSPGSATATSNEAAPAPHATPTPRGARTSGSSGSSSSSSSSTGSSSSSSSDGSDSGSGRSSGGSGGGSGRTAQPR